MNPNYFYDLYKNQIWYSELSILGLPFTLLYLSGMAFDGGFGIPVLGGVVSFVFAMYLFSSFLDMIVNHDKAIQSQINFDRKQMQQFEKNRRRVPVIYE